MKRITWWPQLFLGLAFNWGALVGWTAVMEAVVLGDGGPDHVETARLLVKAGADLSITDNAGATPLEHAEQRGYSEMAAVLRSKGP